VADDFTDWARVITVERVRDGIQVCWLLADGKAEATTYRPEDQFTLLPPDPGIVVGA
jgi:hypothetical protein